MMLQRGGSVRHVHPPPAALDAARARRASGRRDDEDEGLSSSAAAAAAGSGAGAGAGEDMGFFGSMDADLVLEDDDEGEDSECTAAKKPSAAASGSCEQNGVATVRSSELAKAAEAAANAFASCVGGKQGDSRLELASSREQVYAEEDVEVLLGSDERALDTAVTASLLPDLSTASLGDLRTLAIVTEKAELYEDMRVVMRQLVDVAGCLASEEERHLFATAYKNVVGIRRASWRQLCEMRQAEKRQEEADRVRASEDAALAQRELKDDPDDPFGDLDKVDVPPFLAESLNSLNGIAIDDTGASLPFDDSSDRSPLAVSSAIVREELEDVCLEMIALLRETLLPNALESKADAEIIIFYQKLIADYYRYLAEHMRESDRKDYVAGADLFYKEALELATGRLQAANPLLLGLALNVSVFYFEVLNLPDKACQLAKEKHDAAARALESAVEADKDASLLLDLLRENLTVWTMSET
ncbi:14-3-3-like protein [Hondaea fermentalgiana]|uniref:14-3-3-like protein n=1 Tax=Hondaea fermentalgiana TaxID=2315210 RepID=A0A2R5GMR7_9STRA|nr:14-3-3-like protein [Hondaea fermentalgiana]|eukprot:GBG29923.1 14-3-3-like protein [Hondaea fermentalgiana]